MGFILSVTHEKVNINQVETINAYINGFESALAVVAFMPVTVASLPPCAKAAGLCDPRNDGHQGNSNTAKADSKNLI